MVQAGQGESCFCYENPSSGSGWKAHCPKEEGARHARAPHRRPTDRHRARRHNVHRVAACPGRNDTRRLTLRHGLPNDLVKDRRPSRLLK